MKVGLYDIMSKSSACYNQARAAKTAKDARAKLSEASTFLCSARLISPDSTIKKYTHIDPTKLHNAIVTMESGLKHKRPTKRTKKNVV